MEPQDEKQEEEPSPVDGEAVKPMAVEPQATGFSGLRVTSYSQA